MSKETFYFPHDYEPTSDPKIQALLGEFGGLGYGVFWRTVEMLHSEESHKLPLKQYIFLAIAKQMLASAEQIEAILNFAINTSELFVSDGVFFWSIRVNQNFLRREEISEKRAVAGRLGAIAKQNLANTSKEKKKKVKEKKEIIIYSEGSFSSIPDFLKQKWKEIAPGIDVETEIKKAALWIVGNPEKVRSKWTSFLTKWMIRAQDNFVKYGGNGNGGNKQGRFQQDIRGHQISDDPEIEAIKLRFANYNGKNAEASASGKSDDVPDFDPHGGVH